MAIITEAGSRELARELLRLNEDQFVVEALDRQRRSRRFGAIGCAGFDRVVTRKRRTPRARSSISRRSLATRFLLVRMPRRRSERSIRGVP